jgi:proline iminopeptidase
MATLEVNGCRIRYRQWGEGRPLVCLHGGLGIDSSYMDCPSLRELAARGCRVILYDQRGHGRSARPGEATYTHAAWVDDLRAFADGLDLTTFALLGHSYGGFLSLEFALRHASRLSHLVLVGCSAGPVATRWFSPAANDPDLREALRRRWPSLFAGDDKHWERFERMRFSAAAYNAAFGGELPRYDLRDWLGELAVPTLLVAGSEDPYAAEMRAMLPSIPRGKLEIIEGAGHLPFLERPGIFSAAVGRFLVENA